jgi:hypothetical protein
MNLISVIEDRDTAKTVATKVRITHGAKMPNRDRDRVSDQFSEGTYGDGNQEL